MGNDVLMILPDVVIYEYVLWLPGRRGPGTEAFLPGRSIGVPGQPKERETSALTTSRNTETFMEVNTEHNFSITIILKTKWPDDDSKMYELASKLGHPH